MNTFAELVKEFFVPGSAWFLVIAATASIALLYGSREKQTIGRGLLVGLVIVYWALSLPVAARGLQLVQVKHLSSIYTRTPPEDAVPIVVLGNGVAHYIGHGAAVDAPLRQTAVNAVAGIERYHQFPDSMVIVSGGAGKELTPEAVVMRDAMVKNGVPSERILLETTSANTREQAAAVSRILRGHANSVCVLVTSAEQMTRAVELFRREGIEAVPAIADSPLWSPSRGEGWWKWIVPSSEARDVSCDVAYELFAWVYYRARGWIN